MKRKILILMFICSLFLCIGYASVSFVVFDIDGSASSKEQDEVYIINAEYVQRDNALVGEYGKVNYGNGTILNSTVNLDSNSSSEVSLKVSFYNESNYDFILKDVYYGDSLIETMPEVYSNLDISFDYDKKNEKILAGGTLDVIVTFKYSNYTSTTLNILNSILNFDFELVPIVVGEYDYTGNVQTLTIPQTGTYKIELWGASGGDNNTYRIMAEGADGIYTERDARFVGGYGAYTSGEIKLEKGKDLYVYVGEQGKRNLQTTWNGGGSGAIGGTGYKGTNLSGDSDLSGNSGGGATDVRLEKGAWNNFNGLKSRIMVAAGGGGNTVDAYNTAGDNSSAGGLIGFSGGYYIGHPFYENGQNGKGGTQTSGGIKASIHFNATGNTYNGSFGIGGSTTSISSQTGAGGGGGGYYGGSGASGTIAGGSGQGGGGGSSFISGHIGCNAIKESSTETNIVHSGQSVHYSNYKFENTLMIDGHGYSWTTVQSELYTMPSYNEELTTTGNLGNGYAKITLIDIE